VVRGAKGTEGQRLMNTIKAKKGAEGSALGKVQKFSKPVELEKEGKNRG